MKAEYVIDASVGVKLLVPEDGSDTVARLFEQFIQGEIQQLHVPGIFFGECANVLWKRVRHAGYAADDAQSALRVIRNLDLIVTPTLELVEHALEIAITMQITAYDACYLALARQLFIPLISADERLLNTLKGKDFRCLSLNQLATELQ